MRLTSIAVTALLATAAPPALAVPIDALGIVDVSSNFTIAGFGPLPSGLEAVSNPPDLDLETASSLDAPDAVPDSDSTTTILGTDPATPSVFLQEDTSLRNGGSDGSIAALDHQLYQVLEAEADGPDGTNDVSERGVEGFAVSQSFANTEAFDTEGTTSARNQRVITLSNENQSAITFGIEGLLAMSIVAQSSGDGGQSLASGRAALFFDTLGPLDIVYTPSSPYFFSDDLLGTNAGGSISLNDDVGTTGVLSLTGLASAFSDSAALQGATLNASQRFVLGVTLQAGQEMTLTHLVEYGTRTSITTSSIPPVPLPAGFPLLLTGLVAAGLLRSRRRSAV